MIQKSMLLSTYYKSRRTEWNLLKEGEIEYEYIAGNICNAGSTGIVREGTDSQSQV